MQDYAQRLINREGDARNHGNAQSAARAFSALRQSLGTLIGAQGFIVLLTRALTLATSEIPSLKMLQVKPDGSLEGLSECCDQDIRAAMVLMAHLLGLLAVFIGEGLMVRILLDVRPDSDTDDNVPPRESEHDAAG